MTISKITYRKLRHCVIFLTSPRSMHQVVAAFQNHGINIKIAQTSKILQYNKSFTEAEAANLWINLGKYDLAITYDYYNTSDAVIDKIENLTLSVDKDIERKIIYTPRNYAGTDYSRMIRDFGQYVKLRGYDINKKETKQPERNLTQDRKIRKEKVQTIENNFKEIEELFNLLSPKCSVPTKNKKRKY